jgi:hypothetical protein
VLSSLPFHRTSIKKDGRLIKPELPPVHLSQRPLSTSMSICSSCAKLFATCRVWRLTVNRSQVINLRNISGGRRTGAGLRFVLGVRFVMYSGVIAAPRPG